MIDGRSILFVEDDEKEIENISAFLSDLRANFIHTPSVREAIDLLGNQHFDFLLTDLHLETMAGIDEPDGLLVLRAASEHQTNISIVATSSDPRSSIFDLALKEGAHHFIRKPLLNADEILIALKLADQQRRLAKSVKSAKKAKEPLGHWLKYKAKFPYDIIQSERELKIAKIAAKKKSSCVIIGETGTGKEEAAKLIHRIRSEEEGPIPFVAVNCATISGNIAESLLFGHRRGAFTGADQAALGYIAEANGGILFLDEIQTLSIPIQQKLLRVLNDGYYHRLGETKLSKSEFQLIVASTKDLSVEVAEGRFLRDIQMRMMGLDFFISPLRERLDQMEALLALYLHKNDLLIGNDLFAGIVSKLKEFDWPGNIRQLYKCMDAWLLYCELDEVEISPDNFPAFKDLNQSKETIKVEVPAEGGINFSQSLNKDYDFEFITSEFEKAYLMNALQRYRSIADCCKALNIPRSTLDAKRKKYGL